MFRENVSFHGSCAVIDGVVCSTSTGAFIAQVGSEFFVLMQILVHIRTEHSGVKLDGTLPQDHRRVQIRAGIAKWLNSDGRLLALIGGNR